MNDEKKRSYFLRVFAGSDEGKAVLAELAKFARADEADYCADPRKEAYYQGRRSVICEIRKIMKGEQNEL